MKVKKLSLAEAADWMAKLMMRNLATHTPAERRKQINSFKALVAEASSRTRRDRPGKPAISGGTPRTPTIPFAARGR